MSDIEKHMVSNFNQNEQLKHNSHRLFSKRKVNTCDRNFVFFNKPILLHIHSVNTNQTRKWTVFKDFC
jgi:hypothetical protein